jgi:hypothetical protein
MNNLLRLEELAQFLACLFALYVLDVAWWVYLMLLLGPDISMLGYLISNRTGALTYNLFHHKAVALLVAVMGIMVGVMSIHAPAVRGGDEILYVAAFVIFGHASMDRIFGYGLKFGDNFHHTHLGWIGKGKVASGESKVGQ